MNENVPIHVLLVEDEPTDRALVARAFEKHPRRFLVTEKDTIEGILKALDSAHYDVVIMDYKLKGFSGLYMIDSIRESGFEHPVVMLTGSGTEETVVAAMKRGVTDYVIKRVANIERLPHVVEQVAERSNAEQTLRQVQSRIARLHGSIVDAIETFPSAVSLFDHRDRLIICNDKYKAWFFPGDENFVQPDTRFEDLLRRFADVGLQVPGGAAKEDWIDGQIAQHRGPRNPSEYQLADARWLRTSEFRTQGDGTLAVHVDITESRERVVNAPAGRSLTENGAAAPIKACPAARSPGDTIGAEHIENVAPPELDRLRGDSETQGHLHSSPLAPKDFAPLLLTRTLTGDADQHAT